jgi:hypothetical protein
VVVFNTTAIKLNYIAQILKELWNKREFLRTGVKN